MRMRLTITTLLFTVLLVSGCATAPFDASTANLALSPQQVIDHPQQSPGKVVLWGGTILDIRNRADYTQLEILAYPLDRQQRPATQSASLGRFFIRQKGYLEPETYTQGREVTVMGTISKVEKGAIGESKYTYPVIESKQLHLWRKEDSRSRTSFHFGIGIGL